MIREKPASNKAEPVRKGVLQDVLNNLLHTRNNLSEKISTDLFKNLFFFLNSEILHMTFKQRNSKCKGMFPSSKQAIQEMICYSATAMAQLSQQEDILKIHIKFSNFISIYLGSQKK